MKFIKIDIGTTILVFVLSYYGFSLAYDELKISTSKQQQLDVFAKSLEELNVKQEGNEDARQLAYNILSLTEA